MGQTTICEKAAPPATTIPQTPADQVGESAAQTETQTTSTTTHRKSIGRGGFGSVVVQPCGTRVVKTARVANNPRSHRMHMRTILRECSVYIHLPPQHRLLPFYDCSTSPTSASITLGYCKNGKLYGYLEAHPEAMLCQRMLRCIQAAEGLHHLHRHKVIHYDLRPDNLLVADDCSLRTIDSGGSAIDGDIPLAAEAEGYFLPRPPPWPCTKDTEIFALGSTFYHILTGHRPHQARAPQDDITASLECKEYPVDVHDLLIGDIILKCWKSEYKFAVDVFNELASLMDQFRPGADTKENKYKAKKGKDETNKEAKQ